MKIILKLLQFLFKFLSSIFSKLGATYTYNKLFKRLMGYKIISILYKPLRYLFTNILYLFKLISAIIAVLSLFNISLLYYNFDIMDEVINLINSMINWFNKIISDWFYNEDDDEIPEPLEINKKRSRKEIKTIEKSVQSHNYWVIPVMIMFYGFIYYLNPHFNIEDSINPILNKIEDKLPENLPTTFVMGVFIHKLISVVISYCIENELPNKENLPKDKPSDEPSFLTEWERKSLSKEQLINYNKIISGKEKVNYSPTDNVSENEQDIINSLFPKDDEKTPKPSTSQLPEIRPLIPENPFKKTKILEKGVIKADEVHIEEW